MNQFPLDEFSVTFDYAFSSGLGCYEHSRYVKEVVMGIMLTHYDDDKKTEQIGQINFLIIYFDQAVASEYSLYDILDGHSEYLARFIFDIVDFRRGDYSNKVRNHFEDLMGGNICLIEKVTVNPKYRGYMIGAKAIKDLVFNYSAGCALFVLQPYPLQFEFEPERYTDLELDKFEVIKSKAFNRLSNYYKKIGFEKIKGIKELLFYNPALTNKKFDAIDLEENVFGKE